MMEETAYEFFITFGYGGENYGKFCTIRAYNALEARAMADVAFFGQWSYFFIDRDGVPSGFEEMPFPYDLCAIRQAATLRTLNSVLEQVQIRAQNDEQARTDAETALQAANDTIATLYAGLIATKRLNEKLSATKAVASGDEAATNDISPPAAVSSADGIPLKGPKT